MERFTASASTKLLRPAGLGDPCHKRWVCLRSPQSAGLQHLGTSHSPESINPGRTLLKSDFISQTWENGSGIDSALKILQKGGGQPYSPIEFKFSMNEPYGGEDGPKKRMTEGVEWKEVLRREEDFLKALVQEVAHEVPESETEEALQEAKAERRQTLERGSMFSFVGA